MTSRPGLAGCICAVTAPCPIRKVAIVCNGVRTDCGCSQRMACTMHSAVLALIALQACMCAAAQHEHGSMGEDGDERDDGDMHDVEEDMSADEGEEDDDEDDVIDDEILDGGGARRGRRRRCLARHATPAGARHFPSLYATESLAQLTWTMYQQHVRMCLRVSADAVPNERQFCLIAWRASTYMTAGWSPEVRVGLAGGRR